MSSLTRLQNCFQAGLGAGEENSERAALLWIKGQTKKKNFRRSTSATLLCVVWRRFDRLELIAFRVCGEEEPGTSCGRTKVYQGLSCRITNFLAICFGSLDSIWRELYLRQNESFALGHRTSVFSVHPTDPPLFV